MFSRFDRGDLSRCGHCGSGCCPQTFQQSMASCSADVMLVRGSQPLLLALSYFSAVVFIGYAVSSAGNTACRYFGSVSVMAIGSLRRGGVGPRTREMTQRLKATTMPEFFGKRYNSRALRTAAAIIFVFPTCIRTVYNGLSRLFGMAFGRCRMRAHRHGGGHLYLCGAGGYVFWLERLHPVPSCSSVSLPLSSRAEWPGGRTAIVTCRPGRGKCHGRTVHFDVRSRCAQLAWRYHSHFARHVGTPQMVQEVLRHQDRSTHQAGRAIISIIFALVVAGACISWWFYVCSVAISPCVAANGTAIYDSIVPTMLAGLPDILLGTWVVLVLSASMSTLAGLVLTSSSTSLYLSRATS